MLIRGRLDMKHFIASVNAHISLKKPIDINRATAYKSGIQEWRGGTA